MNYSLSSEPGGFDDFLRFLSEDIGFVTPVNRREWQTLDVSESPLHHVHERLNVTVKLDVPITMAEAQSWINPDLPWAESHFKERVLGLPLNPPPSYTQWPGHHGEISRHLKDGKFEHTYPERFWPKHDEEGTPRRGIRFPYGDLMDVVAQLNANPLTRQAYLPVWFPEDTGATGGQRVPCTLGYHFQYDPRDEWLNATYMIRSCDVIRHFRNDVYMAVRLLQWVSERVLLGGSSTMIPGQLVMHIMNLHAMVGDLKK